MTQPQAHVFHDVPTRKRFPSLPRVEPLHADHSSMAVFKECATKYLYQIVLGFRPEATAAYFSWGSGYHKFREVLEKSQDFTDAVNAGIGKWKSEGGEDSQVGTRWEFMTEARLFASFTTAFKHWSHEKEMGRIEVLSVEQLFNVPLPDGTPISGRADQVVRWNGRLWGRDFKTSSMEQEYYGRTLSPNDQFSRYTYAEQQLCGQPVQGQLVEVLFNKAAHKTARGKSDTGPSIYSYVATRTEDELRLWADETMHLNRTLALYRNDDIWPMNESACRYCPFHKVCTKSSEREKEQVLLSDFVHKPWVNSEV